MVVQIFASLALYVDNELIIYRQLALERWIQCQLGKIDYLPVCTFVWKCMQRLAYVLPHMPRSHASGIFCTIYAGNYLTRSEAARRSPEWFIAGGRTEGKLCAASLGIVAAAAASIVFAPGAASSPPTCSIRCARRGRTA